MPRKEDRARARLTILRDHFKWNRDDLVDLRAILVRIQLSRDRVWGAVRAVLDEIRAEDPSFADLSDEEVEVIMDVVAPHLAGKRRNDPGPRTPPPDRSEATAGG